MTPLVHFIEGDPPRSARSQTHQEASGFVLGQLATNPGVWARIRWPSDTPAPLVAKRLRAKGEKLGVTCEAVGRGRDVYARVVT